MLYYAIGKKVSLQLFVSVVWKKIAYTELQIEVAIFAHFCASLKPLSSKFKPVFFSFRVSQTYASRSKIEMFEIGT